MDTKYKNQYSEFIHMLGPCDLPIIAYYSDTKPDNCLGPNGGFDVKMDGAVDALKAALSFNKLLQQKDETFHCMFEYLMQTRSTGLPSVFDQENFGCLGFRFYAGFVPKLPAFNNYFVSTGIPGLHPGEKLMPNPKSAKNSAKKLEGRLAKDKYLVFSRFDQLNPDVSPEVVIFFANPEILTGLIGIIRFVTDRDDAVSALYCSGCSSIFAWPAQLQYQGLEQAVLGVFDIAARPHLKLGEMTIAMSFTLFTKILKNYKKSFLNTQKVADNPKLNNIIFNWHDAKKRALAYEKLMNE